MTAPGQLNTNMSKTFLTQAKQRKEEYLFQYRVSTLYQLITMIASIILQKIQPFKEIYITKIIGVPEGINSVGLGCSNGTHSQERPVFRTSSWKMSSECLEYSAHKSAFCSLKHWAMCRLPVSSGSFFCKESKQLEVSHVVVHASLTGPQ